MLTTVDETICKYKVAHCTASENVCGNAHATQQLIVRNDKIMTRVGRFILITFLNIYTTDSQQEYKVSFFKGVTVLITGIVLIVYK